MVLDPITAIAMLPKLFDLGLKIVGIIKSGNPQDVTEELAALEKARLLPSAEVIAQADADSAKAIDTQK